MATGAVTGLAAEAEIAREAGLVAAAGAGAPEGTERARIPFLVFRVIADTADRDLPPAALVPLTRSGQPSVRVLGSIAARPGQIPELLRLARETRSALEALRKAARALSAVLRRA